LERANLEEKVSRELASGRLEGADPFRLERIDFKRDVFEAWAPIGFLVHIAPTNAINVPFLSLIEGLLAGNVCFVKTGGSEPIYPQLCAHALLDCDASGTLAPFLYFAQIPSRRLDLLKALVAHTDGIAVWGGEEAISGLRAIAPSHARVIEWGPKISFAYVARESLALEDSQLERLARECCLMEQQACSSPQVVYAETDDAQELARFAARFAAVLDRVSASMPRQAPAQAERAEITKVVEIARLESCLSESQTRVIESRDGSWRVLVESKEALRASPLFRTVWVKPLVRSRILRFLRPLRHYLQTVGLACGRESLGELSRLFFSAGVLRLMPLGEMLSGYMGEPHDGVYALQRYSRRVSAIAPQAAGLVAIEAVPAGGFARADRTGDPIMGKEGFGAVEVDASFTELFFKSGGSSGEPKLSIFTYDDYHAQMRAAAHGVYAAGLDPRTDRCINLFFSGGLYGGFLSFFTILEDLKAVQLPMTAHSDLDFVGRMIVEKKVDTLLGMPSYLAGLFRANEERFKKYRGIRKIFFGGEHMGEAQRAHFREEYGVELIRSAAYGSNDIGPMGYQCGHCSGAVHHLHEGLHELEILDLAQDRPAASGEAGRLIFTSRVRKGQRLARYDLGDLGRWVEGACPCGRASPRFELLGRQGDIFRSGGTFLNYRRFALLCAELEGFGAGEIQLSVSRSSGPGLSHEVLSLSYAGAPSVAPEAVRKACLEGYKDLHEVVAEDGVVEFAVRAVGADRLERVATSGKLRHILDLR
jgi:phenylacetate-coenzyme A ligase PaaK-like adenylate-forming protein